MVKRSKIKVIDAKMPKWFDLLQVRTGGRVGRHACCVMACLSGSHSLGGATLSVACLSGSHSPGGAVISSMFKWFSFTRWRHGIFAKLTKMNLTEMFGTECF